MNTEGEIQLNNVLQREVAELHQAIGKLTGRIISLERQKECLIRVAGEDKKEFDGLVELMLEKWRN
jgi:prefoldin subunit 5